MRRYSTTSTARCVVVSLAALLCVGVPHLAAAQVTQNPPQQPAAATQDEDSIAWKTGWNYGARGVLSALRAESLQTGLGFVGFAVLPMSTDFELEGEIGYQTMTTQEGELRTGRLAIFPLRATLRVQLYRFGGAKPYVGGGVGVYINRFTIDQSVVDEFAEQGLAVSANVDPGFGFHAAGGIEWQAGRAHYGFDVKYVFGRADATRTVVDQAAQEVMRETVELNLDGLWLAGGIRFAF